MDLLEGMKAAVKGDSETEVEVREECLEGFGGVIVDVCVPGLEEWCMFGFVEFLCDFWVGKVVGLGECGGALVGYGDGFVKVGGDGACIDMVGEGGGVGVVLGSVMGKRDESWEGECWVSVEWERTGWGLLGIGEVVPVMVRGYG